MYTWNLHKTSNKNSGNNPTKFFLVFWWKLVPDHCLFSKLMNLSFVIVTE